MSDGKVIVPPDSTGKQIDTSEVTTGQGTVERQRVNLSDPTAADAHAAVQNAVVGSEYGLVVREAHLGQATSALSHPVVLPSDQAMQAQVNDTPEVYVSGAIQPLSLTTEGRLRVSTTPAFTELDFFGNDVNGGTDLNDYRYDPENDPWGI